MYTFLANIQYQTKTYTISMYFICHMIRFCFQCVLRRFCRALRWKLHCRFCSIGVTCFCSNLGKSTRVQVDSKLWDQLVQVWTPGNAFGDEISVRLWRILYWIYEFTSWPGDVQEGQLQRLRPWSSWTKEVGTFSDCDYAIHSMLGENCRQVVRQITRLQGITRNYM